MTDDTQRPLKVFLCHAHSDAAQVRALYLRLKADGVDAWLDKENIVAGQDWEYEIRKAVRESDIVIVCLSKQFNQKGYRQNEVRSALEEANLQPEGEIFIIPARLEECDYLESLRRFHGVDLFEERGYEYLMRALRLRAEKIGAVLQSKRSWLPNITIPRTTPRKNAEIKKAESAKKKQAESLREIPNNKIQQKSETPPPANNFPDGWDAEWQPAFETGKSSTKHESTENLEPKPTVTQKPPQKWNTRMIAATAGVIVIFAAIFGLPWYKWFPGATGIATETPTNTAIFIPPQPTLTKVSSTSTFTPISPTKTETPTLFLTTTQHPTEITDKKGITMVLVPAGEFIMGHDDGIDYYNGDEKPAHTVYLDAYYIDKYEVSIARYKECMEEGICDAPVTLGDERLDKGIIGREHYFTNPAYGNYPVVNVPWVMANSYCEWRESRLPTEAEWEKSAKDSFGDYSASTTPIDVGGVSSYGVYNMLGNVQEWVFDSYSATYYAHSPTKNPLGPESGSTKVIRGGWFQYQNGIFMRQEGGYWKNWGSEKIGFRCACDATP